MVSFFLKGLRLGILPHHDPAERSRIFAVNAFCILVLLLQLIALPPVSFLYEGKPLFVLLWICPFVSTLVLNYFKKTQISRFLLLYLTSALLLAFALFFRRTGIQYTILTLACSSTFILKNKRGISIFFIYTLTLFIVYINADKTLPFRPEKLLNYSLISDILFFTCVTAVLTELLFFRSLTDNYSRHYQIKNRELKDIVNNKQRLENDLVKKNDALIYLNTNLDHIVAEKSAALTKSETRYRTLVENQPDFVVLSHPDGERIYFNKSYSDFFGNKARKKSENDYFGFISNSERDEYVNLIQKLTPENPSHIVENVMVGPNGKMKWVLWTISGVFNDARELTELISVGRDISELKKAQQNKDAYIESLENMSFITSHKIRRPVSSILGIINLIEEELINPSEAKEIIQYLKYASIQLDEFTKELNQFLYSNKNRIDSEGPF